MSLETQDAHTPAKPLVPPGKYDPLRRRRSQRRGRMRGCSIDIPAEELVKTGIDLDGPPPAYRVWGSSRGRVVVQLYKEV